MNKVTLIAVCVALLCGVNAFSGGLAPVAPGAMLETARHTIPVSAEDAEEVALDQEVDTALHSVRTHDLLAGRVEAEQSFDAIDQEMGLGADAGHWDQSNFDLSVPESQDSESEHVGEDEALDEEEDVFVAERESVSVAVGEGETDGTSESVSVDAAEEDSTFLQIDEEEEEEEEDSEEEEEEEEEEDSEEEEEDEQESLLESGSIVVHAESIEPEHAPRLSEAHVELVADAAAQSQALAAAGSLSAAVVADEDTAHEAETEVQMVKVEDFDTQKLAETEQELVNPRAGPVSAGLRDKTIEASGVSAEAETVQPEVIALVADEDVRAAAGAALIQTGDVVHHEQDAEEQAQLDLLHSVLAELRASQGRDLNEPLTPADMDEIEARVANLVQIDATTTSASTAAATAAADTETQAKAEAEHPRDHTVVAAVSPTVEAATPGAALKPATIVGGEKKVVAPKPKYRYDVQYHADPRQFMPSQHVELTDKPHPLHARDPTAPSTLKNPVKPQVWKREFKRPNKPQYRYDVQYEKRAQCCRGREACCVRGVQTKTIPAKVKKAVRVVPPSKKADSKTKQQKVSADKKKAAPKQYRWDVEYERQRVQQCCGAKRACCRAPTAMYRADVQYENEPNWFVLSGSGERAVVVGDDELSMLQRIQNRQRLLHKLLLTHDSPLYDDLHWQDASDEHIVQFHEPAAARVIGYGPDGDLTRAEAEELQNWLTQLPVVPHLAVVEVQAHTIQPAAASENAEDASFLAVDETAETVRPLMKPARVLKGFVDVEQEPSTLSKLIAALPPTPLVAQNVGNEEEEEIEVDISELDV